MSRDVSVVALIAAYNEADILPAVVQTLIADGVDVYLLDHGSTDGTGRVLRPFLGNGLLAIEPFPGDRFPESRNAFSWGDILERKRELSMELDADWFIHHDADEFRESIWEGLSLSDAIRRVDELGYNAIDFEVFNFWPTDDTFVSGADPRGVLRYYGQHGPWDKLQVKCWKKTTTPPDLASSGGHDVMFPGRRVFPLRFLLRHYPLRSQAHAERKVFAERRSRFVAHERAKGWHLQYDAFGDDMQFVQNPDTLTEYDGVEARLRALCAHRRVDDLTDRLDSLARRLAMRDEAVRALHIELEQRDEALVDAEQRIVGLGVELAHAAREREELKEELRRTAQRVEHLDAELAQTAKENLRLGTELGVSGHEVVRLEQGVACLAQEVQTLHASKSWRWMAPLRAVHRLIRGR